MQQKINILKKIIGREYVLIRSHYPLETELVRIKSIIDWKTVLALTQGGTKQEQVCIFELRNPDHEI